MGNKLERGKVVNLERFAAEKGYKLVEDAVDSKENKNIKPEDIRNMINKALGILQQNGIYAFFLWLEYKQSSAQKADSICAPIIYRFSLETLAPENILNFELDVTKCKEAVEKNIVQKDHSIDTMFFIKGLLEKMLTYALYRAKAKES